MGHPRRMEPLDVAVASFLEHLEHVRRASPKTVEAYKRDLAQLHAFLVEKKLPGAKDVARIDAFALRAFLAARYGTDATTSVLRKLSAVRSFLRFCVRTRRLKASPADVLESPKRPKPLPRTVSVEEA